MSLVWYTSTDNSTWTLMSTPSKYKISWEDLDNESYRSVTTGNLIRNVVKRRWAKVSLEWSYVENIDTILRAVNKDTVYFKFLSPAFGTSDYVTFKGYVSKMSTEALEGLRGWSLSFNVVQSEVAQWQ